MSFVLAGELQGGEGAVSTADRLLVDGWCVTRGARKGVGNDVASIATGDMAKLAWVDIVDS